MGLHAQDEEIVAFPFRTSLALRLMFCNFLHIARVAWEKTLSFKQSSAAFQQRVPFANVTSLRIFQGRGGGGNDGDKLTPLAMSRRGVAGGSSLEMANEANTVWGNHP